MKVQITLRTKKDEERTISVYEPLPSEVSIAVKAQKHVINQQLSTHTKKFKDKRFVRIDTSLVYEEAN